MSDKNNIIDELRKKIAKAAQESQRGVVLQPGAIGDCILTLPLVEFMKETVSPGGVDIIGHTEYIGILPGRSCVDAVRSMDSMGLHRLFAGEGEFVLTDGDPLIMAFAEYTWIVTFLGEANSDFERNLIFTAHCSHSAEVMTLEMKPGVDSTLRQSSPDKDIRGQAVQASSPQGGYNPSTLSTTLKTGVFGTGKHISDFYREQFIRESGFDPFDKLRAGKLTAGGLSAAEYNNAVGMPLIRPTLADMKKGKEILTENGIMPTRKPIVIQPGSGGKEKCWFLDNFVSVAKMLAREGIEAVFILGPAEMERFSSSAKHKIETAGRLLTNLSLVNVLAVLSNAGGYIGNDSGITHLAAALGVRTVAVFGPTDPNVYGPIGPAVTILQNDAPDFTEAVSETLQRQICEIILA